MDGTDVTAKGDVIDIPGVARLELIGRGGSGAVYRGFQEQFSRDVAVKVLSAPAASGDDLIRWRRELTAMGRLSNHPNIVAVYDSGVTASGLPYLVMPYVSEGSLGDRIRRRGALPADEVAAIGANLAGALVAAHAAGVLHRDVKPDNVLLSQYGPQLADFGIARLVDAAAVTATAAGLVHATINYAAPEVLEGERATAAADVYGLSATLYIAATGELPFPHDQETPRIGIVNKIVNGPRPDPRDHGVPDPLAAIIASGLARDPRERPSAADLQRDLAEPATAATAPVETRQHETLSPTVPVRRPARRRASWALPLVCALVALAAVSLFFLLGRDRGDGETSGDTVTTGAPAASATTAARSRATTAPATAAASDVERAAARYFNLLAAGDYAGAYDMLSPGFKATQSQDAFETFWRSASPVQVTGPAAARGLTATVPIRMAGRPNSYTLTFRRADGGLLVDGPRPRS